MAYEYLKKVIPPVYRFQIKKWGLSERGLYRISDENDKEQIDLGDLLCRLTKSCVKNNYFMHHGLDDEYLRH